MEGNLTNRIWRVPSHVAKFQCQQCGDCCGPKWKIDIDPITYDKVQNVYNAQGRQAEFAQKLTRDKEGKSFANFKNGYCAALTEEKLCSFQKELGPDFLSDTCKVYPRYIFVSSRGVEFALSFSCRAAVDTLRQKQKIEIKIEDPTKSEFSFMAPKRAGYYWPERLSTETLNHYYYQIEEKIIFLLQQREWPLVARLFNLGRFLEGLQKLKLSSEKTENQRQINSVYNECQSGAIPEHDYEYFLQELTKCFAERARETSWLKVMLTSLYQAIELNNKDKTMLQTFFTTHREFDQLKLATESYAEAKKAYIDPFWQQLEYIVENYLVNYVLKKSFFIGKWNLALFDLAFFYGALNFFITGYSTLLRKPLNEEMLLGIILELDNAFAHSNHFFEKINKGFEEMQPEEQGKILRVLLRA